MLKQREVEAEEERLREAVRSLTDEQRKAFYEDARRQLKDPDTYATLNWFFLAGLHHFYLGRVARSMLNLGIFVLGVILLVGPFAWLGLLLIVAVSTWELWALFRSQVIVQDWNNRTYRRLLKKHGYTGPPV